MTYVINGEPRRMPSLYAIADYWSGPGMERARFSALLIDMGEPPCFRCEWRIPELEVAIDYGSEAWVRRQWQWASKFLDRAHLRDRCQGGPDDVSNLVALCHLCHREMPEYADPDEAIRWVLAGKERPRFGLWTWQMTTDHLYEADPEGVAAADGRKLLRRLYLFHCEQVSAAHQRAADAKRGRAA